MRILIGKPFTQFWQGVTYSHPSWFSFESIDHRRIRRIKRRLKAGKLIKGPGSSVECYGTRSPPVEPTGEG